MKLWAALFILLFSLNAQAYFQMEMMQNRRDSAKSSQWTLADWLAQKNTMALMDQWLALNSSEPFFDLSVNGGHSTYTLKTKTGSTSTKNTQYGQNYNLDMYLSIFGIHGEYEKGNDDREAYGGSLGLRLFGTSSSTTYLEARYGWRKLNDLKDQEYWENQFAEGQLQLYLFPSFGLHGKYRHYFPVDSNKGTQLKGSRSTAGVFLDVFIFRVYADYFQEPLTIDDDGTITHQDRDGYEIGGKLYF